MEFRTQATSIIQAFSKAMIHKSAEELASLFTEDARYEFPLLTPGRPAVYTSREEIFQEFNRIWTAAPVAIQKIEQIALYFTDQANTVISEHKATVRNNAEGNIFSLSYLLIMRIEQGKIVHLKDYPDVLGSAVGLRRLSDIAKALQP